MAIKQTMTFDRFQAILTAAHGNVRFEERGKDGWTSVGDLLDGKPGGAPGPHWCDVSTVPRSQRLLANFDFNTSTATFFPVWDRAQGKYLEQAIPAV